MIKQYRARQRHVRLMNVATRLVHKAELRRTTGPDQVTPADVATLAFGRYQLRLTDAEAAEYLAAALISCGHSIDHLPRPVSRPEGSQ